MGGKLSRSQSYLNSSLNYGPQSFRGSSPYPLFSGNHMEPDPSRMEGRHARIPDNYNSLEQVTEALAQAGLESSNLIVGIDFTKSNEWTGSRSFHHKSLHHLGDSLNPYEQAISIIGRTLSKFDEDNHIPCYGFGDASTHDQDVFSFYPDNRPCIGFEEALARYRELIPHVHLAGPTSFAPIIETAIGIVENSGGLYHVLIIIADGQVTRSVDTEYGHLSVQEQDTITAIVKASEYPLSIILIGVGDGPWDMMWQFDDNIPSRAFDNFQFVNFTEHMSRNIPTLQKEKDFALAALMEIPSQFKATIDLNLLSCQRGTLRRIPLPPPVSNLTSANSRLNYSRSSIFEQGARYYQSAYDPRSVYPPIENETCPVCFRSVKDLTFGCGHQMCYDCGKDLLSCPICQTHMNTRMHW